MTEREALKLALEAFNDLAAWNDGEVGSHMDEPYAAEVARITITTIEQALAQPEQKCWCTTCRPITMSDMRFVVCPDCGNKRCPKANDHRNACTNSNEVGQKGSSWEHVKPDAQPEQKPWVCECKADSYLACKCVIKSTPHLKPLTDEEIDKAMAENKQKLFDTADNYIKMRRAYARIIEAAHGIKGEA